MEFEYLGHNFKVIGNDEECVLRHDDTSKFFEDFRWFGKEEFIDAIYESGLMEAFETWFKNRFGKERVISFPFQITSA